jgi:hypothetical protein
MISFPTGIMKKQLTDMPIINLIIFFQLVLLYMNGHYQPGDCRNGDEYAIFIVALRPGEDAEKECKKAY